MNKEQLKAEVSDSGSHYFDRGTMHFFRSRLCAVVSDTTDAVWFVTSERFTSRHHSGPRLYTVRRWCRIAQSVETVGEFQGYETRDSAIRAARRLAAQEGNNA